jgi:hypothetical protein
MYNATDLLLFRVYILLEMIIGKYVLRIIVSNVRHIVLIDILFSVSETDGTRCQYRTVPYRLVPRRYGIGKKEVGRDGTVRYAVSKGSPA